MPLISMTVAAFILNTSEFIPIGLLIDMSNGLSVSETAIGNVICMRKK